MRAMVIILVMSAILIGAALVRGVTYAFTHAVGVDHGEVLRQVVER